MDAELEPIYGDLDDGIKDVVLLLRAHGVNTFTSCEGGHDHDFPMPTIRAFPSSEYLDEEQIKIARILSEAGYVGYYIKLVYGYQMEKVPWDQKWTFVEVEFWSSPIVNRHQPDFDEYIPPMGWL